MPTDNDTIVAIATPPGTGGIGVVRVSGGDCERIARAMLGSLPEPRVATFAAFVDARGARLDEGLALYFPGPASFTGESVPVDRSEGDTVFAASINGQAALTIKATKAFSDNTLSRIIELVESAQVGPEIRFPVVGHQPGVGVGGIVLILGILSWTAVARLVRGQFLGLKEKDEVPIQCPLIARETDLRDAVPDFDGDRCVGHGIRPRVEQ